MWRSIFLATPFERLDTVSLLLMGIHEVFDVSRGVADTRTQNELSQPIMDSAALIWNNHESKQKATCVVLK
jgi:hypothetical protein